MPSEKLMKAIKDQEPRRLKLAKQAIESAVQAICENGEGACNLVHFVANDQGELLHPMITLHQEQCLYSETQGIGISMIINLSSCIKFQWDETSLGWWYDCTINGARFESFIPVDCVHVIYDTGVAGIPMYYDPMAPMSPSAVDRIESAALESAAAEAPKEPEKKSVKLEGNVVHYDFGNNPNLKH